MVMAATVAGDDMAPFHDRQPVLLDAARATTWLDLGADYTPILNAMPPGMLAFDPPEPVAIA